jgi:hypothetical protein
VGSSDVDDSWRLSLAGARALSVSLGDLEVMVSRLTENAAEAGMYAAAH